MPATTLPSRLARATRSARGLLPGLGLCLATTAIALLLAALERRILGRTPLEALVLAIVAGAAIRTVRPPGPRFLPGIEFGARTVLEVAVALLGASLGARALREAGPALLAGIAAVVAIAIACSYGIGRLFGLPRRLAILVACGNSICGNSAIAAVAPVIGADGEDVAASISFTALLGVPLVLVLPLLAPLLELSGRQYGAFAGLTVYAVPQVLAATVPVGQAAVRLGTLVKLVRVLMLGPVVLALGLLGGGRGEAGAVPARPPLHRLLPWFIVAFLGLAALRSAGLLPHAALRPAAATADTLTIVAMAALGLTTDLRAALRAGGRVTAVVVLSMLALALASLALIRLVGLA